jgi:AcrR family transcriptional regulator
LPGDRKSTQRERLLSAMIEMVAREGFDAASIARVIAAAGVSRRAFYEHFRDKEDCFLAALLGAQERLRANVERALATAPPQEAWRASVEAVLEFAAARPADARVAMGEALAVGPRALDVRDQGIARLARAIEARYAELPRETAVPDLAAAMLLGGVYRLLTARLRRGEGDPAKLRGELLAWVASYELPLGEHRWRALDPVALAPGPPLSAPMVPPLAAPRTRGRLSERELVENHRQRILLAVAELAAEKGYRATTRVDVQRRAGIDAEAFKRVFVDKQDAFAALLEERLQHLTAVTAGAFFTAEEWPERIWESGRVFAQVMEQNPAPAHVGFVEVHAAGPSAAQRNDDLVLAFTLFLQQGYEYQAQNHEAHAPASVRPPAAPRPKPPSRIALEAIAATNFEFAYHQIRGGRASRFSGLLAHVTFLCLAPFVGPAEANRFIDGKLGSSSRL